MNISRGGKIPRRLEEIRWQLNRHLIGRQVPLVKFVSNSLRLCTPAVLRCRPARLCALAGAETLRRLVRDKIHGLALAQALPPGLGAAPALIF
jgi:hypothetical protein